MLSALSISLTEFFVLFAQFGFISFLLRPSDNLQNKYNFMFSNKLTYLVEVRNLEHAR